MSALVVTPVARLIAAFYLLSGGWTIAVYIFGKMQMLEIDTERLNHMLALPALEQTLTLLAAGAEIGGSIALLMMAPIAVPSFALALFANVLLTAGRAVDVGLFTALGGAAIFATLFGWGLLGAVCVYTWRLLGGDNDQE